MANLLSIVLSSARPHTRLVICVQLRVSRFRLWWGQCSDMWQCGGFRRRRVERSLISTNSAQLGGGVFIVSCWAIQCFYQVWRKQVEFYCTGPGVKWICITTFVVYLSSVIAICITSVHTFSAPSISIVLSLVTQGSSFKLAHERFLLITITQTCSN